MLIGNQTWNEDVAQRLFSVFPLTCVNVDDNGRFAIIRNGNRITKREFLTRINELEFVYLKEKNLDKNIDRLNKVRGLVKWLLEPGEDNWL